MQNILRPIVPPCTNNGQNTTKQQDLFSTVVTSGEDYVEIDGLNAKIEMRDGSLVTPEEFMQTTWQGIIMLSDMSGTSRLDGLVTALSEKYSEFSNYYQKNVMPALEERNGEISYTSWYYVQNYPELSLLTTDWDRLFDDFGHSGMLVSAKHLKLKLNASNVKSMQGLFHNSTLQTIDLSELIISDKLQNTAKMFAYCASLTAIKFPNNWQTPETDYGMFNGTFTLTLYTLDEKLKTMQAEYYANLIKAKPKDSLIINDKPFRKIVLQYIKENYTYYSKLDVCNIFCDDINGYLSFNSLLYRVKDKLYRAKEFICGYGSSSSDYDTYYISNCCYIIAEIIRDFEANQAEQFRHFPDTYALYYNVKTDTFIITAEDYDSYSYSNARKTGYMFQLCADIRDTDNGRLTTLINEYIFNQWYDDPPYFKFLKYGKIGLNKYDIQLY